MKILQVQVQGTERSYEELLHILILTKRNLHMLIDTYDISDMITSIVCILYIILPYLYNYIR